MNACMQKVNGSSRRRQNRIGKKINWNIRKLMPYLDIILKSFG
jgi:hypothetical protein